MNNFNIEQIVSEMINEAGPNAREKSIRQALDNYLTKIPQYLCRGVDLLREQQLGVPIPKRKIRCDLIGRYCGNKKYWFDWLHQHYPLFEELKLGYKHKNQKYGELTMVRPLNFTQEQLLQIENSLTDQEFLEIHYPEFFQERDIKDLFYWTPIDLESIRAFIDSNKNSERTHKNLTEVLDRNLKDAQRILRVAEIMRDNWGQAVLPQRINESLFGRMYFKGINLQNVKKEVRHAALGRCREYDLENSVFAWKYDIAKKIDPELKLPATLEYIDRKEAIRKNIAEQVFGSSRDYGTIKQAITAIGFGASKTNSCWVTDQGTWRQSSLREIIYSPEKLKLFVEHSWVSEFIKEQTIITKLIYDSVKDFAELNQVKELQNPNGQLNRNKTISYLYQHAERSIMNKLIGICQSHKVLLLCHDAFYTKSPAPLQEMRAALTEFNEFGKIKELSHRAWTYNNVNDHIEHIRQEELKASDFFKDQGFSGLTAEQIDHKIKWKQTKLLNKTSNRVSSEVGRDYDNGYRSNYGQYDYYEDQQTLNPIINEQQAIEKLKQLAKIKNLN